MPAQKVYVNSIGMEFRLIPAGAFLMGLDRDLVDLHLLRCVELTRPFFMSRHVVTQEQWSAVMGTNPVPESLGFSDSNDMGRRYELRGRRNPVFNLEWSDVEEFIRRLNAKESTNRYRLPTEAEWEYAAKEGAWGDRELLDQELWPVPPVDELSVEARMNRGRAFREQCPVRLREVLRPDGSKPVTVLAPVDALPFNRFGVAIRNMPVTQPCVDLHDALDVTGPRFQKPERPASALRRYELPVKDPVVLEPELLRRWGPDRRQPRSHVLKNVSDTCNSVYSGAVDEASTRPPGKTRWTLRDLRFMGLAVVRDPG
jgi:hypothetical protein